MNCRLYVILLFFIMTVFHNPVFSQDQTDKEYKNHKYAIGFNYYSNFNDFQAGGFYESEIDFDGEFGYSLNPSMVVGTKLHYSYLNAKDEDSRSMGSKFTLIPFYRYYLSKNLFFESGVGIGYGFYSFHNEINTLLREHEDIIIYRLLFATGYDLFINKGKSMVVRPSIHYMYKKEKILKYPNSANNNKENEFGISVGFIILI